jgi:CubicO group peptidase (beta-lactamase class C family)
MIPIKKYLKNLFASKRILGEDTSLTGLVKADGVFRQLVDEKKVPGIAVTVLRNGKTLLEKGYGYADLQNKTQIDPRQSIFRIASVSKNIAATALAHMVNDGLIDLDGSFYEYVPYYPKKKWDFTIRQLAGHTAGIRGYRGTEYGLNKPYSIKESIEIFKDDDQLFEPGTDYLYTSFGWVLISLAMQEVSGIPFEEYVYDRVLKPLGMQHTFATMATVWPSVVETGFEGRKGFSTEPVLSEGERLELTKQVTTFYTKNRLDGFRSAIPVNNFFKLAGGGYLSTSEDIAKFGKAYLNGKVLNEKVLVPFLTSETFRGNKTYYGLGWQVSEDKKGRPFYGHIGNGIGGYSNFFVYPEQQLVFSVLINCTDPKVQGELDEVVDSLLSEMNNQV